MDALKSFSLKIVARAGKNMDPTKMAAYIGLTCMQSTVVTQLHVYENITDTNTHIMRTYTNNCHTYIHMCM